MTRTNLHPVQFTSEQATLLSDLIRAAEEAREKGELYTRGIGQEQQSVIMLPYGVWRRLIAASEAWRKERDGNEQRTGQNY